LAAIWPRPSAAPVINILDISCFFYRTKVGNEYFL
jgi:hypothetical protein